ncbi:hypothetical protein EV356DRAFT_374559 [Viridothelium virens]|uniref:Uncharacterized protein n=1 Tax=Viridothelium virens TaxID=1048519 RepID=A0A6A6GV25_VIRVR|nr:hypothetical protein EV356DRAFT_374559 [Viridothelium virens]
MYITRPFLVFGLGLFILESIAVFGFTIVGLWQVPHIITRSVCDCGEAVYAGPGGASGIAPGSPAWENPRASSEISFSALSIISPSPTSLSTVTDRKLEASASTSSIQSSRN